MIYCNPQPLSPTFEKFHLLDTERGHLTSIHLFMGPDVWYPHDHPWDFHTEILRGGYIEDVYTVHPDKSWSVERFERRPGTRHFVPAETIHLIVEILDGVCLTRVDAGPDKREVRFWKLDDTVSSISWREKDRADECWQQI